MKNVTDMEEKRYTYDDIHARLEEMMGELSDMMERCDEKRSIGIIYAFAHLTGTSDGEGVSVAAINYDGEGFGGWMACVCALSVFLNKNRELAEIAMKANMIETKKIFGI